MLFRGTTIKTDQNALYGFQSIYNMSAFFFLFTPVPFVVRGRKPWRKLQRRRFAGPRALVREDGIGQRETARVD